MTIDDWLSVSILLLAFGLLGFSKQPPVAIFVSALTVILTLRMAPESAVLTGFSNTGVLTVGALFLVAVGLYATSVATMIADQLIGRPGTVKKAQLKILHPVTEGCAFLTR
jgi:hypothetical protein